MSGRHLIVTVALMVVFSLPAQAEKIKIFISSGTGFFVNNDGFLLTNLHVVENCERIIVNGAVSNANATIVARDSEYDLALLRTNMRGTESGKFRSEEYPIEVGERVLLLGYPGNAYQTGKPVTREASITKLTGPRDEAHWMQMDDIVSLGNSGGPLLDRAGRVIGVVQAKAVIYSYKQSAPHEGVTTNAGIAITLPVIEAFLDQQGLRYDYRSDNLPFTTAGLMREAKKFIVSVRCEYRTEITS
jgi:serine protease Do